MSFHLNKFVPENVVTAFLIAEIRKAQVFAGLVRTHDGATVKPGESFRVPGIGDITVGDYTGVDIAIQDVADTGVDIAIDQLKYFAFYLDKVDNEQAAKAVLNDYVSRGAYALSDTADAFIASAMTTAAGNTVTGGAIDATNVIKWVGSMKQKLDENSAPTAGRWLVVNPQIAAAIAEANITTASTTSEEARGTGYVQRFMDFDIYMSNNLVPDNATTPTKFSLLAGVESSTDYLNQIQDLEFGNAEKRFATYSKGLHVYGVGITQAKWLVKSDIDV